MIEHFKTITKHKFKVMHLCFRCHLYKQGLLHDLSKYMPCEFLTGVKYYQGTSSPNGAERRILGYSNAWLHHKGRNKHHWEYYVDFTRNGIKPAPMPNRYIIEMFCDRVCASQIYNPKTYTDRFPLDYYLSGCDSYYLHDKTKELIEFLLHYLDENGLDQTIDYINKNIDKNG